MTKAKTIRWPTDERIDFLHEQIAAGNITKFSQLFLYITKTALSNMAGMRIDRFTECFSKDPGGFRLQQFFRLGEKLGIDPWFLLRLLEQELKQDRIPEAIAAK